MGWNGSGSFSRTNGVNTGTQVWQDDRDDGTKIRADRHDTHDQDVSDGVNACLAKNGENAATGNLNLGANRYTNAAAGTASTDLATVGQAQSGASTYATDTGAADAYAITPSPAITAYAAGQVFSFVATNTNTGASTLNVSGLGTKFIQVAQENLVSGTITSGDIVRVEYDGTAFQLLSLQRGQFPKIKVNDGSLASPAITFKNDPDNGFSTTAADTVDVSAGGSRSAAFTASGVQLIDGTAGAPSLSFRSGTENGLFLSGTNEVSVSCSGTSVVQVQSEGVSAKRIHLDAGGHTVPDRLLSLDGPSSDMDDGPHIELSLDGEANPALQLLGFAHDSLGFTFDAYYNGTNWISSDLGSNYRFFKTSDVLNFDVNSGTSIGGTITWSTGFRLNSSQQVLLSSGLVGAPGLAFIDNEATGLFRSAADTMQMVVAGGSELEIKTQGIAIQDGTVAAPSFSFINDIDSGICRPSGNVMAFVTGGTLRFRAGSNGIEVSGECRPLVDNTYDLGELGRRWDDIYATNSVIITSDIRLKNNVRPCDFGLEFVEKLSPIVFKRKGGHRDHYGFGAQHIETVIEEMGRTTEEFAGIIKADVTDDDGVSTGETRYGLRYGEFIAPLVKAVQELSEENKKLKSRLDKLEKPMKKSFS